MRVPGMLWYPGVISAAQRLPAISSTLDVFATVLKAAARPAQTNKHPFPFPFRAPRCASFALLTPRVKAWFTLSLR